MDDEEDADEDDEVPPDSFQNTDLSLMPGEEVGDNNKMAAALPETKTKTGMHVPGSMKVVNRPAR